MDLSLGLIMKDVFANESGHWNLKGEDEMH
jgi:hypothetical protein